MENDYILQALGLLHLTINKEFKINWQGNVYRCKFDKYGNIYYYQERYKDYVDWIDSPKITLNYLLVNPHIIKNFND